MDIHSVSLKGKRPQNEDKHSIILNIENEKPELLDVNFFGVYDGHGGKFVSKFLAKNLPNFFVDKRVKYPLKNSYINGVYVYLQNLLKEKFKEFSTNCGSTCLTVIHFRHEGQNFINVINSGDCRCVICTDNIAVALTKDHKPNWPEEKRRIEKLGGQIYYDGSDFRIKDLSVSRAFGDLDASPYVTNLPDIFKRKIENSDKFIIMACDGLWDVMSNSDAVNYILNECYDSTFEKRINKEINIARKLAEHAIAKGSTDNITILIIFLK
ncbi:serine/threonine protein phosphatase [Catovirus CTV1]|uniref:Serine/threonine protein phosphatase n=1 Tax=Catovirus CTV1 TaxID=1977631 RepID=A0A1V0SC57_9VIRU|nr:serine/threonine protein phosphatase [Catovirus CTV1]